MEVERFLTSNPGEVVTLFIEDYVRASGGLTRLFNASGLSRYWKNYDLNNDLS
jgi:hypothetical protein